MDLTPQQLGELPTWSGSPRATVSADEIIRIGLTKPFHEKDATDAVVGDLVAGLSELPRERG